MSEEQRLLVVAQLAAHQGERPLRDRVGRGDQRDPRTPRVEGVDQDRVERTRQRDHRLVVGQAGLPEVVLGQPVERRTHVEDDLERAAHQALGAGRSGVGGREPVDELTLASFVAVDELTLPAVRRVGLLPAVLEERSDPSTQLAGLVLRLGAGEDHRSRLRAVRDVPKVSGVLDLLHLGTGAAADHQIAVRVKTRDEVTSVETGQIKHGQLLL